MSIVLLTSLLFHPAIPETLNCIGHCGPCSNNNELCGLTCRSYESCKDARLSCIDKDNSLCQVDCMGEKSCLGTMLQAQYTAELVVNCKLGDSCAGLQIYSGPGSDVFINCDDENSCNELVLHGYEANDVYVNCIGENSCSGVQITCGSGKCILACLNTLGGVCHGVFLDCGTSPQCQINCSGGNKCDTISINAINAIGFQCIGTVSECVDAPVPFMLPTRAPTPRPSLSPSETPTKTPTNAPTGAPTQPPTSAPTFTPTGAPSPRPTRNPTPAPTFDPTKRPSKSPSPSPTKRPTDPTANPSKSPTKSPSPSPTSLPTEPSSSPTESPTTSAPTTTTSEIVDNVNPGGEVLVAENSGGNPLANLNSDPGVAIGILICIILGALCCCCIPIAICVWCFFKRKNDAHYKEDSPAAVDAKGVPFGDIEGDYNKNTRHYRLERIESKSVPAKDGYRKTNLTVPRSTNGRISPLSDEDSCSFVQDHEFTKEVIQVTIWFLEKAGLPQYAEVFILNGYNSLDMIKRIKNMHQLDLLGVERGDHRFQIMAAINVLAGRGNYLADSDSDEWFAEQDGYERQTGGAVYHRRQKNKRRNKRRGNREEVQLEMCDKREPRDGADTRNSVHSRKMRQSKSARYDPVSDLEEEDEDEPLANIPYAQAYDNSVWQIDGMMDAELVNKKKNKNGKKSKNKSKSKSKKKNKIRNLVMTKKQKQRQQQKGLRQPGMGNHVNSLTYKDSMAEGNGRGIERIPAAANDSESSELLTVNNDSTTEDSSIFDALATD